MTEARPLRDVFADLAGSDGVAATSPTEVLAANGHPALPEGLVAEAIGSYADTAPIEVAEHLSPYVMAHSPVPLPDLADADTSGWFDAVANAPAQTYAAELDPSQLDATDLDATDLDASHLDASHLDVAHVDAGHTGLEQAFDGVDQRSNFDGVDQRSNFGQGDLGHAFTLDGEAGEVRFGDGPYGQVPPEDTQFHAQYADGAGDPDIAGTFGDVDIMRDPATLDDDDPGPDDDGE
jgi:hypothetical protein